MAAGYSVGIASETKAFKQGVETGMIKPLEDANKELEELGKNRGPEQLERDLKDAQKATEKLADETKDTARIIEQEYKDAYRKMKNDADDAFDGAKRGSEEFKQEAQSTGKEAAASFKEPADALDAVQELAANALVGLGPAGVIAGTAAAVGIGAVTTVLQTQQEEADKLKEALASAYQDAVSEGRVYLDEAQIIAGVHAILFDPEKKGIYDKAIADAKILGVTVNDVLRAQAGDQEKVNLLIEAGRQKAEEGLDSKRTGLDISVQEAAQLGKTIQSYNDLKTLHEENNSRAERAIEIERQIGAEESANTSQAKKGYEERWAKLDEFYKKAANPPAVTVPVTADVSDVQAKINALQGQAVKIRLMKDPRGEIF